MATSRESADFIFSSDGVRGLSGINGGYGQTWGEHGGDAGPAFPGGNGGTTVVYLESAASGGAVANQNILVRGTATRPDGSVIFEDTFTVAANQLGKIIATARGGDGGNGGIGGNGAHGMPGRDGRDAGPGIAAENGQSGGPGGDSGAGTSGADAGCGGVVRLKCPKGDEYLFMAVDGLDSPLEMVRGGFGGQPGAHGVPGSGGPGGYGGAGYTWTEYHQRSFTDHEGRIQYETVPVTFNNAPGYGGSAGRPGKYPTRTLFRGMDGVPGRVELVVAGDRLGLPSNTYSKRYDLTMDEFAIAEEPGPNVDGIFEFGEMCHAAGFVLRNVGGMPSPFQRVRLELEPGKWYTPVKSDMAFLSGPLEVSQAKSADGRIRFQISYPDTERADDYAPIIISENVVPKAIQLGPELQPSSMVGSTPFERTYPNIKYTRALKVRFPIGNERGITGLRSMAPGEQGTISLDIFNYSKMPLGVQSMRRSVCISVAIDPRGDIGPDKLHLYGPDGKEYPLGAPSGETSRQSTSNVALPGYVVQVPLIQPQALSTTTFKVGLEPTIPIMSGFALKMSIAISDIADPSRWRVVQRRRIPMRAEPSYQPNPQARFVLVTSTSLDRTVYNAWDKLFREHLGEAIEVYSVSRYGHLDLALPFALDGVPLGDHFKNKIVIVPNMEFNAGSATTSSANAQLRVPSELLPGVFVRSPLDASSRTRFLFIGDREASTQPFQCASMKHFIEPVVNDKVQRLGGEDFKHPGEFWKELKRTQSKIRSCELPEPTKQHIEKTHASMRMQVSKSCHSLGTQMNENPASVDESSKSMRKAAETIHSMDPAAYYHVVEVASKGLLPCFGSSGPNPAKLMRIAEEFTTKLEKECPNTAFAIVAVPETTKSKSRRLGHLHIRGRRRVGVNDTTAVHVYGAGAKGGTKEAKISESVMYGLAMIIPFAERLDRLERLLRKRSTMSALNEVDTGLVLAFLDAMVADIAAEVQETMATKGINSANNSSTNGALLRQANKLHEACQSAHAQDKQSLLHALAVLSAVSKGVAVWFAPFGWKRNLSRQIGDVVNSCLRSWFQGLGRKEYSSWQKKFRQETAVVKKAMNQRRTQMTPLVKMPTKTPSQSARFTYQDAMFDYCQRPNRSGGRLAVRDTEVASLLSSRPIPDDEWTKRLERESARDLRASVFFLSSSQERIKLLQSQDPGMQTKSEDIGTFGAFGALD
eukprot:CAMPEP_0184695344 /NCGR_PEP_ID=MMETSP0313-20130426/3004_1 /TAXON_ID=2792 /ORGANISM="Porphyridium aerugineum, Strain SAG 1380-2" /LENGTH=1208 /DNA_ID=CAMNT_0027153779 /DNA_START=41 /DNA_END=3667 /DNA_ORIENTATION=-